MIEARKTVALYGRQSQGRQASVDDQIREGQRVADRENWSVFRTYTDLVSASRFGGKMRADWAQLNDDIDAGRIDIVIVWDASRSDRTPESWFGFLSRCREHGAQLYAIRDQRSYDVRLPRDWRVLAEDGVTAAYESEIRSVDVRRGIAGAALAGKQHSRSAFGYTREYNPTDRRDFREVPNERAEIVREIFARVAAEEPLKSITDDLNARGVPTPGAERWDRKTVRRIVRNHAYIGMRTHRGELHKGNWPPLVTESVFYRAKAVLDAPNRRSNPPGATRYLLSYLATAPCGGFLQATAARAGTAARYRCCEDGCVGVHMDTLDTFVTELTLRRLAKPDAMAAFTPDDEETSLARERVAAIGAELDDLAAQLADGAISATLAGQAEQGIRRRLAESEAVLARYSQHAALVGLFESNDLRASWEATTIAGRRSVLKALYAKITLGPTTARLTRWSSDKDRLDAVAERLTVRWAGE